MKRRTNGELQDTHRYTITFNKPELPQIIRLTKLHFELVELFVPKPMRCTKYQRLGHTQKFCRREQATCAQCGEDGHRLRECEKEANCVNCGGQHRSSDNKCPQYAFKSEVLVTQTKRRCTFYDAQDEVRERFREEGKSYSFAARRQQQAPQSNVPLAEPDGDAKQQNRQEILPRNSTPEILLNQTHSHDRNSDELLST